MKTLVGLTLTSILALPSVSALGADEGLCRTIDRNGLSEVQDCGGWKFVRLEGSPMRRAHDTGVFVKNGSLRADIYPFFGKQFEIKLGDEHLQTSLLKLVDMTIGRLAKAWPSDLRDELHAFADAADLSRGLVERVISAPDLGNAIGATVRDIVMDRLGFGCTSGLLHRSDLGRTWVGRNLDFPAVGVWDKHPALLLIKSPPGSGELDIVSFATEGLYNAGISAVNSAGVALFVHQNFLPVGAERGVPLYFVSELVLRKARGLEEAIEILNQHRPGPAWTFVLADYKNGQLATVEASAKGFHVRRSGRRLAQANHLLDPTLEGRDAMDRGRRTDSLRRMATMDAGLRRLESSADAGQVSDGLAGLLAQQYAAGAGSIYLDILKPNTIQSVVVDAGLGFREARALWSVDRAPTASGRYVALDLDRLFALSRGEAFAYEKRDPTATPSSVRQQQMAWGRCYEAVSQGGQKWQDAKACPYSAGALVGYSLRALRAFEGQDWSRVESIADEAARTFRAAASAHVVESLSTLADLARVRAAETQRLSLRPLQAALRQRLEQPFQNPQNAKILKNLVTPLAPFWSKHLRLRLDFFSGDLVIAF